VRRRNGRSVKPPNVGRPARPPRRSSGLARLGGAGPCPGDLIRVGHGMVGIDLQPSFDGVGTVLGVGPRLAPRAWCRSRPAASADAGRSWSRSRPGDARPSEATTRRPVLGRARRLRCLRAPARWPPRRLGIARSARAGDRCPSAEMLAGRRKPAHRVHELAKLPVETVDVLLRRGLRRFLQLVVDGAARADLRPLHIPVRVPHTLSP